MSFVSAEVPFVTIGNRRALSSQQLANDPYLADFVRRFSHCFEYDVNFDAYIFLEKEETK